MELSAAIEKIKDAMERAHQSAVQGREKLDGKPNTEYDAGRRDGLASAIAILQGRHEDQ